MAENQKSNQVEDSGDLHSLIREFHAEPTETGMCMGNDCPTKNCRVCAAAGKGAGRTFYDAQGNYVGESQTVWDPYRASVKRGYYTSTVQEIVDPVTGERRLQYVRPG